MVKLDIFIAGVGTGGTLTGTGEYLRENRSEDRHLEPASSPVLSEGKSDIKQDSGIGAGFVPDVINTSVYDDL